MNLYAQACLPVKSKASHSDSLKSSAPKKN